MIVSLWSHIRVCSGEHAAGVRSVVGVVVSFTELRGKPVLLLVFDVSEGEAVFGVYRGSVYEKREVCLGGGIVYVMLLKGRHYWGSLCDFVHYWVCMG